MWSLKYFIDDIMTYGDDEGKYEISYFLHGIKNLWKDIIIILKIEMKIF